MSLVEGAVKTVHHVAIIMDGNRRWAKKRFLPSVAGHWAGAKALTRIVRAASDLGIRNLTVFAFSTENWQRPKLEVDTIFEVLKAYLIKEREEMIQEGVRLRTIGDLSQFPQDLLHILDETVNATAQGEKIDLILALNYGARDEIVRATRAIAKDCKEGKLEIQDITEKTLSSYLDSSPWPDPELLIRTSGEMRLSNFMLWQLSYTEVYVTDTLWPEFSKEHLVAALEEYKRRERRRGT